MHSKNLVEHAYYINTRPILNIWATYPAPGEGDLPASLCKLGTGRAGSYLRVFRKELFNISVSYHGHDFLSARIRISPTQQLPIRRINVLQIFIYLYGILSKGCRRMHRLELETASREISLSAVESSTDVCTVNAKLCIRLRK